MKSEALIHFEKTVIIDMTGRLGLPQKEVLAAQMAGFVTDELDVVQVSVYWDGGFTLSQIVEAIADEVNTLGRQYTDSILLFPKGDAAFGALLMYAAFNAQSVWPKVAILDWADDGSFSVISIV